MGQVYCGAYAGHLRGGWHEGYAAMELPDGELTATWTADAVVVAQVAACDCGWRGSRRYGPDGAGEDAAMQEWRREHLDPLIVDAAGKGWPAWAARVSSLAREIAGCVADGRLEHAAVAKADLGAEVLTWARILDELVEEASR